MKLLIIGGHLSPALSLIDALPEEWEIVFVGRKFVFEGEKAVSLEYRAITKLGVKFINLSTGRLQRKLTIDTFPSLLKLPVGFLNAFKILLSEKPDAVVGFGGYVQVPVVIGAFLLRIPVVLHEQTLEVGFANRICAKFARKICISWTSSAKFFPKEKTVLTGIPLRKEVLRAMKEKSFENKIKQIFITGGSSGSHFINSVIEGCIEGLLRNFKVTHLTGDSQKYNDFDRLSKLKSQFPHILEENYELKKFVEPQEFTKILRNSDLIISRSGINTVFEIFILNKPAILIPIPFAQRNEQLRNAMFLKDNRQGEVFEQKDLDSETLLRKIYEMTENLPKYKKQKELDLPFEKAAYKIIKVIKNAQKESKREK